MVVKHYIKGYEKYVEFINSFKTPENKVLIYFTGDKDDSGNSWCSDCNNAWPVVSSQIDSLPDDVHFVIVEVGERNEWKDFNNPFRKDKVRLMVIPTLIVWNDVQRLEGFQCEKTELVSMMIDDD